MINVDTLNIVGQMCSASTAKVVATTHQFLWKLIVTFWPWQWFLIVTTITVWTIIEILTRNGTFHYNSENGFSPSFNRFVGTGTYAGFQGLFYLLLTTIFGGWIYCFIFPIVLHIIIFRLTGIFLNKIGFWTRVESPKRKPRWRRY